MEGRSWGVKKSAKGKRPKEFDSVTLEGDGGSGGRPQWGGEGWGQTVGHWGAL